MYKLRLIPFALVFALVLTAWGNLANAAEKNIQYPCPVGYSKLSG